MNLGHYLAILSLDDDLSNVGRGSSKATVMESLKAAKMFQRCYPEYTYMGYFYI